MTFKNHYNSEPELGEINDLPDETVPDQSMSVSEILRRFANGLPLGGERVPLYEGDDDPFDGVNPAKLDISEIRDMQDAIADELHGLNKKQQQKKDEREFNKKLKEANSLPSPEGASEESEAKPNEQR